METDTIRHIIYEGKEIKPGLKLFISKEILPDSTFDKETNQWTHNVYKRPMNKKSVLNTQQLETLKSCLSDLSKRKADNIFPNLLMTRKWKWGNAGVLVMYDNKVYTFWHDSNVKEERNIYEFLNSVSPIKIEIEVQRKNCLTSY